MKFLIENPVWTLKNNERNIYEFLVKKDPYIIDITEKFNFEEKIPFIENLNTTDTNEYFRPKGSHRAFYLKLKSGGVLAIKGAEILSNSINEAMINDSLIQIGKRPWTKYENFIYREQKSPLALHFNEGEEDQLKSLTFHKKMIENFNSLEPAPFPLYTFKLPKSITNKYMEEINPFLNKRSREIIFTNLEKFGLGIIVYYYSYPPYRIRFENKEEKNSIIDLLQKCEKNKNISYNPFESIDRLLNVVSKMLISDLMPLSRESHGIGQCIAPQNVTLLGGIADMGSIIEFDEIKSESEFIQLFYSSISVLTATLKEFLIRNNSKFLYEFDDPTPISIILSNYCINRINSNFRNLEKDYDLNISSKLKKIVDLNNLDSSDLLKNKLMDLF